MKTLPYGRMAAAALTATGYGVQRAAPAHAVLTYHDATSGVATTAAGSPPAVPAVSSTHARRHSAATGAGGTPDWAGRFRSAHVSAGNTEAVATVTGVSWLHGAGQVAVATASCRNGAATSQVIGVRTGRPPGPATLADDVRTKNQDGSTTVIALQLHLTTGHGTASTINVATATCASVMDRPSAVHDSLPVVVVGVRTGVGPAVPYRSPSRRRVGISG